MKNYNSVQVEAPADSDASNPATDNDGRRRLVVATGVALGTGAVLTAVPFLGSLTPSERARAAGAAIDVAIDSIAPGTLKTIAWRGRPVWLLKRTPEMLASLKTDVALLADPLSAHSNQPPECQNQQRSLKPDLAVIVGVCTHLGCTPNFRPQPGDPEMGPDWPGGFYCPCHGSRFDLAGRVFKNVPAPINLDIPAYHYLSDGIVRVGE